MSREDFEHFEEARKEKAAKRRETLGDALDDFPARAEIAERAGYRLRKSVDSHWLLDRNGATVAQYWPGAGKWQKLPSGKIRRGPWSKFAEHMERGNF